MEPAGALLHAEALEPPGGAGDLPAEEELLVAVRRHRHPDDHAEEEQDEVVAVGGDHGRRRYWLSSGWPGAGGSRPKVGQVLRVVIAEDNALLRDGLVRLIDAQDDMVVAEACADVPGLLAAVDAHRPEVVVTDIRMPPTGTDEGIQAAADLRIAAPSIGVVVLSQYANPAYALALLEGGSEGRAYLLKERVGDVHELLAAIREVAGGRSVIDPKVVE